MENNNFPCGSGKNSKNLNIKKKKTYQRPRNNNQRLNPTSSNKNNLNQNKPKHRTTCVECMGIYALRVLKTVPKEFQTPSFVLGLMLGFPTIYECISNCNINASPEVGNEENLIEFVDPLPSDQDIQGALDDVFNSLFSDQASNNGHQYPTI